MNPLHKPESLPLIRIGAFATTVTLGSLAAAIALPYQPLAASPSTAHIMIDLPAIDPLPVHQVPITYDIVVEERDTLMRIVQRAARVDPGLALHFQTDAVASHAARQLRPGQTLRVLVASDGSPSSLVIPTASDKALTIQRGEGTLISQEIPLEVETHLVYAAGVIDLSLFAATDKAGIPESVAVQIAEVFSGDVDFHRDLRRGDRFAVVYEHRSVDGRAAGAGQVVAASFSGNDGRRLTAIRFATADGSPSYYDPSGRSMKRAFLRSPLEFSRVTSSFSGSRLHPVLRQWRAHAGVDYGAPIGTPVRSTADGVIAFLGQRGGYGNLIVLDHRGGRSTAYGHLNGFARGLRAGQRVEQGQTIGYVGQTGLASGPHLHYEFRINGRAVNPLSATLPQSPPLGASDRVRFLPAARQAGERLSLADSLLAPPI